MKNILSDEYKINISSCNDYRLNIWDIFILFPENFSALEERIDTLAKKCINDLVNQGFDRYVSRGFLITVYRFGCPNSRPNKKIFPIKIM